ncbi:MAG: prephenate dehydrogenase [Deltaproteobacteria bacterium]|nr:prephenate dehydrogenase [Deltaproteobacteria bacterium]MBW1736482.1 prephenate dehydrogenase [Deltaproteobacteria bacterium]MBW1909888.1 prephenate dehydrogenase [Deltaproteobacteria bacterium]MBW2032831.1 prephenate dehydrogenase [Deltaproteobacteria bacterium]MBW2113892.1 prephenate dehydrogenase [Deltaproteobacteria bacterium]
MRIFVLGAGHMGAWLVEELCLDHEVAVYDLDRRKLKYFFNVRRLLEPGEAEEFKPELLINAVGLPDVRKAFDDVLPYLAEDCILSDIASVKTGLYECYKNLGKKFVSTHPMFGPTFANIRDLRNENAIIIKESDEEGKEFFRNFYKGLKLSIYEYTFEEHDKTIAYSLSIPFVSSMVFAACMKKQEAPGTTFRRHLDIVKGLLSEDDHLLAEIVFNPHTVKQIENINSRLAYLTHIIRGRDYEEMQKFLNKLRNNIE